MNGVLVLNSTATQIPLASSAESFTTLHQTQGIHFTLRRMTTYVGHVQCMLNIYIVSTLSCYFRDIILTRQYHTHRCRIIGCSWTLRKSQNYVWWIWQVFVCNFCNKNYYDYSGNAKNDMQCSQFVISFRLHMIHHAILTSDSCLSISVIIAYLTWLPAHPRRREMLTLYMLTRFCLASIENIYLHSLLLLGAMM